MSESLWIPLFVAVAGLIFWAGVLFGRVENLREWRNAQQREADALKLATADLAKGHVGVVRAVAFLEGMLQRRTPESSFPAMRPHNGS